MKKLIFLFVISWSLLSFAAANSESLDHDSPSYKSKPDQSSSMDRPQKTETLNKQPAERRSHKSKAGVQLEKEKKDKQPSESEIR
ncbi:hypothetical protein [Bdellovibrio sp. NC01]|uniref:hypothetical protein n=1 Tax=Bdellovibrio sp. NC01 TaxID=2220073 RepID=UPI001158EC90|nr:hypothetical protein [Bdellovibrio sp. NC01]QDK38155.1 hypothetical protein DOE51_11450 [Bdellovibrio sp. NC01]